MPHAAAHDGGQTADDAQYVLAIYCSPPGMLSLAPIRHDHNMSLWRIDEHRITLQRYWEFERVSGEKHHYRPLHDADRLWAFVDDLLRAEGLTRKELSAVWGTPGLDSGWSLPDSIDEIDFPVHSLAHLFSAIAIDTEILSTGTVLGMAMDARPDLMQERYGRRRWYAGCVAREGAIEYVAVESPAPIWMRAAREYDREPGTLMALASATTCAVAVDIAEVLATRSFFGPDDAIPNRVLASELDQLVRDALAEPAARAGYGYDPRFNHEDNVQSATMKLIQETSMALAVRNITSIIDRFHIDPADTHLALSGGFALNCPTNTALMDRFGFRSLLTPPCVNDSGQSLGIALLGLHASGILRNRQFRFGTAFHGSADLRFDRALERYDEFIEDVTDLDAGQFATDVIGGPVAWVRGEAEIGPRALGHRSLLGDPRRLETKERLNAVKRRQWWRPVAPIVLAEHATDWFEQARPSPYMLEAFRVRPERADQVPAIVHLDGTARVQTLTESDDPVLYSLVSAFGRRTGVAMLANTSLNDKGEPIVDDVPQALNFCLRRGITVLYAGGRRVRLRADQAAAGLPTAPEPRYTTFDEQGETRPRLWAEWLARGGTPEALYVYAHSPELRRMVDLSGPPDRLNRLVAGILRLNPDERTWVRDRLEIYGPERSSWPRGLNARPDEWL